jgi:hypothetical protein
MHNPISAASRRRAGLAASVVLAGGLAGGVLLMPGTAFASSPVNTSASFYGFTQTTNSNNTTTLTVPVEVSAATGTAAPNGTVTVSDGSITCGITLTQVGTSPNSDGSCDLSGLAAGSYTINATYSGSSSFNGSATLPASVTIGSGPAFTADSPPTTALTGGSYTYNFNAIGNPAPTYSLVGAPGWLSINSSTGVVLGTVLGAGRSFTYSVEASNSLGTVTAGPVTVQVSPYAHPGGPGNGRGNLSTSLSCSSPVRSGQQGTCNLYVTNNGANSQQNVFGTINLPSALRADFCGHGWGWGWYNYNNCSISGNSATEDLGTLRPGQTRTVTVTFTAQSTRWLWGWGRQFSEWVRVTGSAGSQYWGWYGNGNQSRSTTYVKILPPRFRW